MAINIDHQKDIISSNSATITVDQTGSLVLPKGNTSERPSAPVEGMVRYNSDTLKLEQYTNGAWSDISTSSIGDLVDVDIVPQVGDIILYETAYYGVQSTIENQYWGGKNPEYPNNDSDGTPNPLNPDLDQFGNSVSIIVSTYYIPADKVALSPYKERF